MTFTGYELFLAGCFGATIGYGIAIFIWGRAMARARRWERTAEEFAKRMEKGEVKQ